MYQEMRERALRFLNEKPLLRVAALAAFDREGAEILDIKEDGALLRDAQSGIVFLCADSDETAEAMLFSLPDCDIMTNERTALDGPISARYGFTWRTPVNNTVYESDVPVPVDPGFILRPLTMDEYPLVREHYQLLDGEGLAEHVARGDIMGGYTGDDLVGFIGRHDEGSLGMLYVFPWQRRKGYAWQMEGHMINRVLALGERVFGQVILGNESSLALQRKIGMTISEDAVSWLGR
ncbi:MAG: GNAT family N-acetyltransferase [Eubacteriales bacterium]|nr:GNAT family N-acetyltransferase [Eubacteriales bacterium]